MLKSLSRVSLIVIAGVLCSSVAMAQDSASSGSTGVDTYSAPPSGLPPPYAVFVPAQVNAGQNQASTAVGVGGSTDAVVGTQSSNSYHAVGVGTATPGQACPYANVLGDCY